MGIRPELRSSVVEGVSGSKAGAEELCDSRYGSGTEAGIAVGQQEVQQWTAGTAVGTAAGPVGGPQQAW